MEDNNCALSNNCCNSKQEEQLYDLDDFGAVPQFLLRETTFEYRRLLEELLKVNHSHKKSAYKKASQLRKEADELKREADELENKPGNKASKEIAKRRAKKNKEKALELMGDHDLLINFATWRDAIKLCLPKDFSPLNRNHVHRVYNCKLPGIKQVATDKAREYEKELIWKNGAVKHLTELPIAQHPESICNPRRKPPRDWDKVLRMIAEYNKMFFLIKVRYPAILIKKNGMSSSQNEVSPSGKHEKKPIIDFITESVDQMDDEELAIVAELDVY